jgi:hypothetical protein
MKAGRRQWAGLALRRHLVESQGVWDQPYLETCCRAALHRLHLCGTAGRPVGLVDDPCLVRLSAMGLCLKGPDGRFAITPDGTRRHADEILNQSAGSIRGA